MQEFNTEGVFQHSSVIVSCDCDTSYADDGGWAVHSAAEPRQLRRSEDGCEEVVCEFAGGLSSGSVCPEGLTVDSCLLIVHPGATVTLVFTSSAAREWKTQPPNNNKVVQFRIIPLHDAFESCSSEREKIK